METLAVQAVHSLRQHSSVMACWLQKIETLEVGLAHPPQEYLLRASWTRGATALDQISRESASSAENLVRDPVYRAFTLVTESQPKFFRICEASMVKESLVGRISNFLTVGTDGNSLLFLYALVCFMATSMAY
jgi:hypothetical protein